MVGMQARADDAYIEKMRDLRTRCAQMSADMLVKTAAVLSGKIEEKHLDGIAPEAGTSLYDPCAVGCLLRPALFSGKYGTVRVNTDEDDEKFGMTSFIEGNKRNCLVTYKVDRESFKNMLLDSLAALS